MSWAIGVAVSIVAAIIIWIAVRGELGRRKQWFETARATLGGTFGAFEPVPSTDRQASKGKLDGVEALFVADATTTNARLEVPLRADVERGRVFNIIVREEGGALETSRPGDGGAEPRKFEILVGWDDEHGRLVFRTRCRPDAAATVKALVEEAKGFQERLPAFLDERAKDRTEAAAKAFGDMTGADGRHKHLGLALSLPPEEWELVNARPEGVEWERLPPGEGEAPPTELRVYAVPTADALADEEPRLRLIERFGGAFSERQPDGAFAGPAPDPKAASVVPHAAGPSVVVVVDHTREIVLREDETAARPYRALFQGVFLPWAVAVFELVAPRDEADALLARILAGATFEKPAPKP